MKNPLNNIIHRRRGAPLGLPELIAIALGGMVGGGIFTIMGISVSMIGVYTPIAIFLGGIIAALAAYSYTKLGVYYKDEGATYAFYKKVFPKSPFAASLIGWWVIFGYISTLALYAYTFSSYAISDTSYAEIIWVRKVVACGVIAIFAAINVWSVKGMGRLEDLIVYTKLIILGIISFVLISHSKTSLPILFHQHVNGFPYLGILIVASITFVAYEGFQLVINAVNEMETPEKNIPRAIYAAIVVAILIYVVIAIGALVAIPINELIENKEYALASGVNGVLGHWGKDLVIAGAMLATSSAISGTVFGASRQMAVIAQDGYFPAMLAKRKGQIPVNAILAMSGFACVLVLSGELRIILEFGSITFLLVSFLMAFANFKVREQTDSSGIISLLAIFSLGMSTFFIFYYEVVHHLNEIYYIFNLYFLLTLGAYLYSSRKK